MALSLTKWRIFIKSIIQEIDSALERNEPEEVNSKIKLVTSKLMVYIPGIRDMDNTAANSWSDHSHEYNKQNLLELKAVLESIIDTPLDPFSQQNKYKNSDHVPVSVKIENQNNNNQDASLTNTNRVNTNLNLIVEFQSLKDQINSNGYLSEEDRNDILKHIEELESINDSDQSRPQKWNKIKPILNWMGTKGIDVALKFMPLLMKMFENPS